MKNISKIFIAGLYITGAYLGGVALGRKLIDKDDSIDKLETKEISKEEEA